MSVCREDLWGSAFGFSLHLTVVFSKEPVKRWWSDSQNSSGDEVHVLNYWNTDAGNTASVTCVWVCDQCCQVHTLPAELAYFCRGLLFSPRVKAISLWPPSGALRFFANLVDLPSNSFWKTAQNLIGLDLITNWAEFLSLTWQVYFWRWNCAIHSQTCISNMHWLATFAFISDVW